MVILSIANFHQLCSTELWISFGAGKHHRYIPAHQIAVNLGEETCRALTFFHAFTGCDTVSAFSGKGIKSAFDLWNICPSVTAIFGSLSSMPDELRQEHLETIERFVILWYDRTSRLSSINDCRRSLFSKGRNLENFQPTQDALEQHALRAAYQAGFLWAQATVLKPVIPTPGEWGWELSDNRWRPKWTSIPEASLVCKELINCGSRKACRGLCKCSKANLPCTELCYCAGMCHRD